VELLMADDGDDVVRETEKGQPRVRTIIARLPVAGASTSLSGLMLSYRHQISNQHPLSFIIAARKVRSVEDVLLENGTFCADRLFW
jgi:hypothetical protein